MEISRNSFVGGGGVASEILADELVGWPSAVRLAAKFYGWSRMEPAVECVAIAKVSWHIFVSYTANDSGIYDVKVYNFLGFNLGDNLLFLCLVINFFFT